VPLAHRFARTRACTRASAEPPPRGLSPRALGPTRSRPLFRIHLRPRQRGDGLLRASWPPCSSSCDLPRGTSTMRTTDFCFPLPRLRAPMPRELPISLRDLRLALDRRACTRDQETGEPCVSRRPIRFGGFVGLTLGVVLPSAPARTAPLTPLSLPFLLPLAFTRSFQPGLPRPFSTSLREDGTTSTTWDAFHR